MTLNLREFLAFLGPALALVCVIVIVPLSLIVITSTDPGGSLAAYKTAASSTLLRRVFLVTFEISIVASTASVILALPIAFHLARQSPSMRVILSMLVLLPFWTSILVKSYAFTILFGENSLVTAIFRSVSGSDASILFTRFSVIIGMVHFLLPFCVFPILANLIAQDVDLPKVARAMGAGPLRIIFQIRIPLAMPAIVTGFVISMILSLGMYVTPALLGGKRDLMLANLIDFYTRETLNWPLAAVIAMTLIALAAGLLTIMHRLQRTFR